MASIRKHTQTGALFFDFRYGGVRCREYTTLTDAPGNRKKMGKVLQKIEEQISLGTFNYREFFPNSKNAAKFDQAAPASDVTQVAQSVADLGAGAAKPTPLFKEFANTWFDEKSIEWRTSHKKTIRDDIDKRLIPQFGERAVGSC